MIARIDWRDCQNCQDRRDCQNLKAKPVPSTQKSAATSQLNDKRSRGKRLANQPGAFAP
jgi:hypothetical protein